jgi:acyl-CoA thioesterase FadM
MDRQAPPRFPDELAVRVTVEKVGRSSVTYGFEFHKEADLLARGKITAVLCRAEEGGLETVEIPGPIRDALLRGPV